MRREFIRTFITVGIGFAAGVLMQRAHGAETITVTKPDGSGAVRVTTRPNGDLYVEPVRCCEQSPVRLIQQPNGSYVAQPVRVDPNPPKEPKK
jgi:hypothetical protein